MMDARVAVLCGRAPQLIVAVKVIEGEDDPGFEVEALLDRKYSEGVDKAQDRALVVAENSCRQQHVANNLLIT